MPVIILNFPDFPFLSRGMKWTDTGKIVSFSNSCFAHWRMRDSLGFLLVCSLIHFFFFISFPSSSLSSSSPLPFLDTTSSSSSPVSPGHLSSHLSQHIIRVVSLQLLCWATSSFCPLCVCLSSCDLFSNSRHTCVVHWLSSYACICSSGDIDTHHHHH